MKHLARALRANMTDAEKCLWYRLRARRLGGFKFRRQLVIEPYIVDFACLEAKLIVEVDGGQHDTNRRYDQQRSEYLRSLGFRVLRYWNHEILKETETVVADIYQCLLESPHPTPSP